MTYGDYPQLEQVRKILVVKLRHHGDVLLTSPLFSSLHRVLQGAKIDAFLYADTLPMLEGHPAIDAFLLYDRNWKKLSLGGRLLKEAQLLWKIRRSRYDLVINLTEGDRGAIAAAASGARYRVGFDPQGQGFQGKSKIYTHLAKHCPTPRHTVERQLDVLRRIGIFPAPWERDLTFVIPEEDSRTVRSLLAGSGMQPGKYLLVHPVSRWRFKCPPPHLIAQVIAEQGWPVVLTAGPESYEKQMAEEIGSLVPEAHLLNLTGKITLKQLGALIQMSRALVCVDSVPLHIASALKTPVVALFGPTSEHNWGPWRHPKSSVVASQTRCRPCGLDGCGGSKKSDCLYTLSAREILDALQKVTSTL